MRGRLLAALLACTAVLVAGAAVAPASVAAQDSSVTAEIEYVNGDADAEQVEVSPDDGMLTFTAAPAEANGSELVRTWSLEGDAAGELSDADGYDINHTIQYELTEADVGNSFDVVLTVDAPDGSSATDRVTVSVVENATDPGTDPGETDVTADLQYVNGEAQTDPIEVSADAGTLSFVGLGSADGDSSDVVRTWSLEGDAAGELTDDDSYDINHTVQYEVAEADVGNSFDVVLTVTAADGTSATDSVTVSVSENGSDPGTDPGDDPASTNVTADLQYVNGEAQTDPIEVSTDAGTLSFVGLGSAENATDLVRTWSIDGEAAGELADADNYDINHTIQYEVTEADAGNTFDVVLTVTAPDGSSATDRVTVSVSENGSDPGTDPGTDPGNETPTERHLGLELTDGSIETGETTEVQLVLDEVPADGLSAATVDLSVDGDVAQFTGAHSGTDDYASASLDATAGDDTATLSIDDSGGHLSAGAQDVVLASVELEAVAGGTATVSADVTELTDGDGQSVPNTVGSATLGVSSSNASFSADIRTVSDYVANGSADEITVPSNATTLGFWASGDYNGSEFSSEWSTGDAATGALESNGSYGAGRTAAYAFGAGDAGQTVTVFLTTTGPDDQSVTTSVAIAVGDDSGSDDPGSPGEDNGTDEGGEGNEGNNGNNGGGIGPIGGGDDDGNDDGDDSSDDEGGTNDDDPGASPGEFTLSASSSGDQVVITGENARQGDTASTDLGVAVGALQLSSFEATAGQDADSFELTLGSASGPVPMQERVVAGIELDDSGMLSASALEFAIDESQLSQGVASEDLVVYGKQSGTWTETDVQVGQDGAAVDLSAYDRIAILEPDGANGGAGDDSMSGFSIAVVVGLLVAVVAGGYYMRD